jgi:N-acetylglucosaminyldiphosphoundecaprenol N-acetyl-beta-D-mannosaminyltransferase
VLLEGARHAGLVVPDGMPLVFLQRLMGHSSAQRVYGPELFLRLCTKAAQAGWRIFLLGGAPGQSRHVRAELQARFPALRVVGELDTPKRPPSIQENERATWHIKRTGAHLVFLGLGCPHQERWMAEHHERLPGVVLIGVGAAFDFVTSRARQAPRWVQYAGFEWLFRLLHEPTKLWYRYTVVSARFFSLALQQFVRDIVRSQS